MIPVVEREEPVVERRRDREPVELDGGDPACWLGRVCDECGALIEGPRSLPCWRCGAVRAEDEA